MPRRRRTPKQEWLASAGETGQHIAIFEFLEQMVPQGIWFHPANGEKRDKRTAAKLKRMGVRAGIGDIVGLLPMPVGRVMFEVKDVDGATSAEQDAIRWHCERFEIPWFLVRSIDDVRAALASIGIPTREAA